MSVHRYESAPKLSEVSSSGSASMPSSSACAALFERIDVLGMCEATVTLTEHVSRHGFGAVPPEEFGMSVSGRGDRSGGHTFQLTYEIVSAAGRLVEVA
jgi:hypothetical protein